MITEVNFLQSLHTATKRDYLARMNAEKPECMRVAKQYGFDYWDGDRKFGYGGYKHDGRWKPVAEAMARHYGLYKPTGIDNHNQRILDIGCGKSHLLYELGNAARHIETYGIDVSQYAVEQAHPAMERCLWEENCTKLHFDTSTFHFVYSINVLHNLSYSDLKLAIEEMCRVRRVSGNAYICVESYRTEEQLYNLQCWALTCKSFYTPDDWKEILRDNGYTGDVEFITFS